MYEIENLENNDNVVILKELGPFKVIERVKDLSVNYNDAQKEYYASKMNIRSRQMLCDLSVSDVVLQIGEMQWSVGDVKLTTGLKGAGDFFGKMLKGSVTSEAAVKPEYSGTGEVMTEPTYRHIILVDLNDWESGIVVEDGAFLACEEHITRDVVMRNSISSAVLGGEGLFNLRLSGSGAVALESDVPSEELIEIILEDDELRVDGSMAVAWSDTLKFTVERASSLLMGSAATGEGLVNVYRGTGRVLMSPYE